MNTGIAVGKRSVLRKIKQWASRRFVSRVHRITHRMPVELRTVNPCRVMILAPHMDDEVIGLGGTMTLHRKAGSQIGVVFTSDSGSGEPATGDGTSIACRRAVEARAVAEQLGFEILEILGHPDGNLSRCEPLLAGDIARRIREWSPDQIFCPFPADHHRDHQATAAALADAIRESEWDGEVWCYEVWSTLWPNVEVDITSVVETKREIIELYASQVADMSYVESTLGLNRFRGLRVRVPYAEAFFVSRSRDFLRLAGILSEI